LQAEAQATESTLLRMARRKLTRFSNWRAMFSLTSFAHPVSGFVHLR